MAVIKSYECPKGEASVGIVFPDGITYWKNQTLLALNIRAALRDEPRSKKGRREFFAWVKAHLRQVKDGVIVYDPRKD